MCAQAISRVREEESFHKECDKHARLLSLVRSAQCVRHIVCVARRYTIQ
jgi:hypothetical protein